MRQYPMPHPLYERVRDHLEQAAAVLPRDICADALRELIGEAVDLALELSYRRRQDGQVLTLRPSTQATEVPADATMRNKQWLSRRTQPALPERQNPIPFR